MQVHVCQICNKRTAKYVCQECGRMICEVCLELRAWVCSECYGQLKERPKEFGLRRSSFFKFFLFGVLLIFMGVIFIVISAFLLEAPISAGVVLILGPLPIILGTGPYATLALILVVILTILSIIMFFMFQKRRKLNR